MNGPRPPEDLEALLGYTFRTPGHLTRALTRLAYAKEHSLSDEAHLDALATLGDAVIEVLILTRLVIQGGHDKGEISVRKMDMVNMSILRKAAESLDLHSFVRWGRGEEKMHVWTSGRVLAECLEALAGAIYLDGGLESAEQVLDRLGLLPRA